MSRVQGAVRSLPAALRSALRPLLVGVAAGALAGAAWGLADQPTYEADAGVVVVGDQAEADATTQSLLQLARGEEVARLAAAGLGDDLAGADLLARTEYAAADGVIVVTSTAEIPDLAAGAADAFAAALVEVGEETLDASLALGAAAELPREPLSDRAVEVSALLGALLAAAIGALLVAIRELRRRPVRAVAALEAATGLPVLAVLGPGDSPPELVGPRSIRPTQIGNDRMGSLLAALRRRQLRGRADLGTLAVVSPAPGEGRTAVTLGLAAAWAGAGVRAIAVETDLRRPEFARRLGLEGGPGLRGYLAGTATAERVIEAVSVSGQAAERRAGFDCVAAGRARSEPGVLLAGSGLAELLARLGEAYEVVILDTAPLLSSPDALLVAEACSSALLVARYGASRTPEVAELGSLLIQPRLLGAVLCGAPHRGPGRRRVTAE